jgi:translation initiation factor 2 subunit 1
MTDARLPRMNDIVIAKISKVAQFGAYCKLPEYENLEVFLPIKEVSSGWIKNIREYIHEGQMVVCKVYFFDKERGTVDISLKKVTPKEAKDRIGAYNLEKRLAALFQRAVKISKMETDKEALQQQVRSEFGTFTEFVRNASDLTPAFEESKLPKKLKNSVTDLITASKKKKKYIVSYLMKLSTYNTEKGATELRSIVSAIKSKGVSVSYISAPKYHLLCEGENYVDAESKIKSATDTAKSLLKHGMLEIEKEKLKKEKEDIMETI